MFDRLRNGALAGGGALLLVLALSGMAMGASLTSDSAPAGDTSFVDIDGDGVADHCQTETAAENAEAALAAFEAADLNDDGEISVSEAAQSGWTGGVNCNHGGYVSEVAQADEEACETETTEPEGTEETTEGTEETTEGTEEEAAPEEETADCEATEEETTEEAEAAADETCEAVAAPELDPATDTSTWNHGAWVTWVAKSDATGGKNCNHGGAVSEASKAANEVKKAEREAAKAEREAKRAEQKAARDLKKQERQAAKANKGHGKPN